MPIFLLVYLTTKKPPPPSLGYSPILFHIPRWRSDNRCLRPSLSRYVQTPQARCPPFRPLILHPFPATRLQIYTEMSCLQLSTKLITCLALDPLRSRCFRGQQLSYHYINLFKFNNLIRTTWLPVLSEQLICTWRL
jgi:hypothetical protein